MQNLLLTAKNQVIHATSNSRLVQKGGIFFARKGANFDGNNFIESAVLNGAKFIFHSSESNNYENLHPEVSFIFEAKLEEKLDEILNSIYKIPTKIVAITGTNGKSSTAFLAAQSVAFLGHKSGFIGTLGCIFFEGKRQETIAKNSLTTPDLIDFFYQLAVLKHKGADFVFFEASSIGILQGRIKGVPISIACFTNFTQDHLDFHGNLQNYFDAKLKLFTDFLPKNGVAILNKNDPKIFPSVFEVCQKRGIKTLTIGENADFFIKNHTLFPEKILFDCNLFDDGVLNFSGRFHLENILFVIAVLMVLKFNPEKIKSILPILKQPKGRLECIHHFPFVFVDYAHTPDSLEKSIETLRQIAKRKIILVFGCGGGRDKIKRPIMGEIASKKADFTIITDDNPRTENAKSIRSHIISGFSGSHFGEIGDRRLAILRL